MRFFNCALLAAVIIAGVSGAAFGVLGPAFSLDDNPAAPITSPIGMIPGFGAEDPYGIGLVMPPLAPSPTLGAIPAMDADILMPNPAGMTIPAIDLPISQLANGPFGYVDAVADNAFKGRPANALHVAFSVDRVSFGMPNTDVAKQAGLNQQPGDIFRSLATFPHPSQFAGIVSATTGYAGALPTVGMGTPSNLLIFDEAHLCLTAGNGPGNLVGPSFMCPPIMSGTHDNTDAANWQLLDSNPQDRLADAITFLSVPPDERFISGLGPADIIAIPPMAPANAAYVYAPAASMGLLSYMLEEEDNIDALVVWEDIQSDPAMGNAHLDYALFSLSPGSPSLQIYGLSEADVFFTNFTGAFWKYEQAAGLGLFWYGQNEGGDNIDAMEVMIPGDVDLDGDVDISDFLRLKSNYGTSSGASWMMGDFDGDGDVDITDFLILKSNYGTTT